jgi:hypothetical protein
MKILMPKHVLFQDVLFENYPSLEIENDFIYCQMFMRDVTFPKVCP